MMGIVQLVPAPPDMEYVAVTDVKNSHNVFGKSNPLNCNCTWQIYYCMFPF